jgi:IS605 OrfB family transposase
MNKTMRYEIIKPMDCDWKEFGQILWSLQRESREIANKTIQLCWEYQGFSSEYKHKFGEYPKNKEVLNYAGLDGYCYDKLKQEYNKFNSGNYTCVVCNAVNKYKNDLKDTLRGEKSIINFKANQPIDLHNKNLTIIKENGDYHFNLSLISNSYKVETNRKSGQFLVLVKVGDNNHKCILDRCISGEYKISASKILYDKKKNKWFVNLCYGFETAKLNLNKNNVMGIDMGIVYPVYMAFNNSLVRYKIDGGEINQFRNQIEKRKNQLYAQGKYCGQGRIGHGIKTRIKPIDFATDRVSNFRDTINHKYSKYVVDMAVKNNCGVIQMEKLEGISANNAFLKKWSYFDLQTKIIYKANQVGIEVIMVDPQYTSQRCSKCGHIDSGNRDKTINQSKFKCLKCEFEVNADYNAAKNLSIINIDKIIENDCKELGINYKITNKNKKVLQSELDRSTMNI